MGFQELAPLLLLASLFKPIYAVLAFTAVSILYKKALFIKNI